MQSTKLMLLGALIMLLGLMLAEQTIETFFFRNWSFLTIDVFTNVLPLVALIITLIGLVLGLIGFFQKKS